TNPEFICLTPGIRPAGAAVGDQKRVMTPADAYQIGSDYIVVGRPITQAEDPVAAYHAIKDEWTQDWN
ncbi:MAG: orotidine 5'-phosphate decarboxylase / HUMPS family protein, partial [Streptococcus mitis]|nr:orotidine 5'-phosphate decarboxylase / HUMPS family protein [Streptococcus mitis]